MRHQTLKTVTGFVLAGFMAFSACSPNLQPMEEDLGLEPAFFESEDPLNSNPVGEVSCEGNILYSVPYDASQWGELPNNNLSVRVYPEDASLVVPTGCNCKEIAYYVVFDLPKTAVQYGVVSQPSTSMAPMSYEPFVVEESPSTTPPSSWTPPVVTMDPYPLDLPETVDLMFEVDGDFPVAADPGARVARVIGICIVGDIPDMEPQALWIDFEHVPQ